MHIHKRSRRVKGVAINESHPEHKVIVGKKFPTTFKKRLGKLLEAYKDVFAWSYSDMTGITRTLMIDGEPFNTEHRLHESRNVKPSKQPRQSMTPEKYSAIIREVSELVKAGILREVKNPSWVANPIIIQ